MVRKFVGLRTPSMEDYYVFNENQKVKIQKEYLFEICHRFQTGPLSNPLSGESILLNQYTDKRKSIPGKAPGEDKTGDVKCNGSERILEEKTL